MYWSSSSSIITITATTFQHQPTLSHNKSKGDHIQQSSSSNSRITVVSTASKTKKRQARIPDVVLFIFNPYTINHYVSFNFMFMHLELFKQYAWFQSLCFHQSVRFQLMLFDLICVFLVIWPHFCFFLLKLFDFICAFVGHKIYVSMLSKGMNTWMLIISLWLW